MAEVGLLRRIAEVARALQAESGSQDTLELSAALAVDIIDGAQDAALSLVRTRRVVDVPAATSQRALAATTLQQELGSGPLLGDVWDHDVVSSASLSDEMRWDAWSLRASTELGIGSMLCFRMFASGQQLGAISVYSSHPHAFSGADVDAGVSFAAHAAIAIEVARDGEHKELALDSRSVIGQATGIVMERYGIDAVRAFAVLKRISQHSNVKLHAVASELIRTRTLDGSIPVDQHDPSAGDPPLDTRCTYV